MSIEKVFGRFIPKTKIPRINLVLFLITLGTTFVGGYLQSRPLVNLGLIENPWQGAIAFSLGIMAIIGCHEMGHKLMADRRGIEATFPYFIPAPPPLGTFGAVIRMKTRPQDRNSLFDVGAAGPIAGFLALIPVTILGLLWSIPVPIESVKEISSLPEPILLKWLVDEVVNLPAGSILLVHPLVFVGWIGMIITMLNLMPVGMLDGGHIWRALFGDRILCRVFRFNISLQRAISLIGVVITILLGYWIMALLMLYFGISGHPGPTNDEIPLSNGRKILGIGIIGLLIICATPIGLGF